MVRLGIDFLMPFFFFCFSFLFSFVFVLFFFAFLNPLVVLVK